MTWRQDLRSDLRSWLDEVLSVFGPGETEILRTFEREVLDQAGEKLSVLPVQLIHRDCHLGNIVTDGVEVVGFIDCDHFCIAPRIFDLAYLVANEIKFHPDDETFVARWLARVPLLLGGYDDVCELADREREAFPYAVMSVFVMFAWWFNQTGQPDWSITDVRALGWAMDNLDAIRRASL